MHGIGNKPVASVLKCQWDNALFGVDLGERSRMAYWVNREYYPFPIDGGCSGSDLAEADDEESTGPLSSKAVRGLDVPASAAARDEIEAITDAPEQQRVLAAIAAKVLAKEALNPAEHRPAALSAAGVSAKILPLPSAIRKWLTRHFTRLLLRDVNDFLFRPERRQAMEQSLLERLRVGGGPFVVVAHSQGTMVAYNVLRQLDPREFDVRLLVTMGSPLGIDEVQDVLKDWTSTRKLPFPPCVKYWVNVADRLDPVAADANIEGEYDPGDSLTNHADWGLNPDSPRHPHSATGYLRTPWVRDAVRSVVGADFAQAVKSFVLARDLAAEIEDAPAEDRHPVLIQLRQPAIGGPGLGELRATLAQEIEDLVRSSPGEKDSAKTAVEDAQVEALQRFVSARLTRREVEVLRDRHRDLAIDHVWRNARKRALVHKSTHTIQCRPANQGYGADGSGIDWAVLDTGVWKDHPHFACHGNVVRQWDCTKRGAPAEFKPGSRADSLDKNGHGTHVAGIIAGFDEVPLEEPAGPNAPPPEMFSGMAPRARIHDYKVLDDRGNGQDSFIIKALDHIAETNERAGMLAIQGVNLSLGGGFDPSVFGCGHTPLCEELRRLWRQGVVVCLAAGNEGFVVLQGEEDSVQVNADLSIGDPANLEDAISVGSVHRTNPHTYGISYFSSRGPTADGRVKPDVVAPGEKILSACHRASLDGPRTAKALYVEMSGTSMATPHVSGLLAAFLSLRREFIGYPDRVKQILLANCTDLQRDKYMQGSGLPNLIRMLANS